MKYVALRDFDNFKKGDLIPEEIVEGRLIRGKKIGLADGSEEVQEIKEELITEVDEVQEIAETKEEILLEDSSNVSVEVKEEVVPEVVTETKKSKK